MSPPYSDIREIDALIKSNLRDVTQTEVAEVSEVAGDGLSARVKRQGQTAETKLLKIAAGLTVVVGDRVQLVRIGGDLNTAYIAAVVG
jgi:hypothetical protein